MKRDYADMNPEERRRYIEGDAGPLAVIALCTCVFILGALLGFMLAMS